MRVALRSKSEVRRTGGGGSSEQLQQQRSPGDTALASMAAAASSFASAAVVGHFIRRAARCLRVPHTVAAAATVLYHKFQANYACVDGEVDVGASPPCVSATIVATSAVFLACKLLECPRKMRDVANVCLRLSDTDASLEIGEAYWAVRSVLARYELVLLRLTGFDDVPVQPHLLVANYAHVMGATHRVLVTALAVLSDAYLTPMPATQPPHVVAAVALYVALSMCHADPVLVAAEVPANWWTAFGVSEHALASALAPVVELYEQGPGQLLAPP